MPSTKTNRPIRFSKIKYSVFALFSAVSVARTQVRVSPNHQPLLTCGLLTRLIGIMKATCILLFLTAVAFSQVKKPQPPPVKIPFAESLQAVVVTTENWTNTKGEARVYERSDVKSEWKAVGDEFDVVIGRSGLAWGQDSAPEKIADFKKEGDGKSPAGLFPLTFAFGKADSAGSSKLSYRKLDKFTECIDDAASHHYNRVVGRMQVGVFDWKSSEKMAEITPEYDLGVFVAYNSYPVVKGNGSCIFLHIWKDANTPTSGCTAMEKANLEKIVNRLDPKKNPYLVQLPEGEYANYQRSWNLPKLK
jgi:D-alanyl-D-alanine dipeptidase